ncbi:hypothetical protein Hdeb2414_s0305g00861861 [Helianthus debilis subsp. tardiflorus]
MLYGSKWFVAYVIKCISFLYRDEQIIPGIGTDFTEPGTFSVPIRYRLLTFSVPNGSNWFVMYGFNVTEHPTLLSKARSFGLSGHWIQVLVKQYTVGNWYRFNWFVMYGFNCCIYFLTIHSGHWILLCFQKLEVF